MIDTKKSKKLAKPREAKAKAETKPPETKNNQPASNRISGQDFIDFMFSKKLSQANMCQLFGISLMSLKDIYTTPEKFVHEPVTCYLYRQFAAHPELIREANIDIVDFYESIGGNDAISGTNFSLVMGRELSAYNRWFEHKNPSPSINNLLKNAMKLNGGDSRAAFESIKELCHQEGTSRGIDVLVQRAWHDAGSKKKPAKKAVVAKEPAAKKAVAKKPVKKTSKATKA